MIKWLESALEKAKNLPGEEIQEPEEKVKYDEVVVGMVPKDLQKFRTVIWQKIDKLIRAMDDHLELHDDPSYLGEECPSFHKLIEKEKEEIEELNKIFWIELKRRISYRPDPKSHGIGIRKNWAVVEYFEATEYEEEFQAIEEVMKKIKGLFHIESSN